MSDFNRLIYFSIVEFVSVEDKNQKKKYAFSIKTRKTLFFNPIVIFLSCSEN